MNDIDKDETTRDEFLDCIGDKYSRLNRQIDSMRLAANELQGYIEDLSFMVDRMQNDVKRDIETIREMRRTLAERRSTWTKNGS